VGGERVKLQVFAMRSMASGAAFHCAYRHATQQAFLEAHERISVMKLQPYGTCYMPTSCGIRVAKRWISAHWSAMPGHFR
jgi:hypothetical protein